VRLVQRVQLRQSGYQYTDAPTRKTSLTIKNKTDLSTTTLSSQNDVIKT